ncbi:hypothetical protein STRTUCAR8_01537 [Streptomyces turgidiscabies Car8]|uniref:Uncharacterized protein n=1 Tax=Streptomyces turgidiscabies (strain Car8) TaxID=698760 RepID=L7F3C1_STRT8|nr:hypothetical protein STRTUCAR8_01537 [Streptomyces turgidiscabies Car8]
MPGRADTTLLGARFEFRMKASLARHGKRIEERHVPDHTSRPHR